MQNESLQSGSMTNEVLASSNLTFADTDPATFAETIGTFQNPYSINNESLASGTITNESL